MFEASAMTLLYMSFGRRSTCFLGVVNTQRGNKATKTLQISQVFLLFCSATPASPPESDELSPLYPG